MQFTPPIDLIGEHRIIAYSKGGSTELISTPITIVDTKATNSALPPHKSQPVSDATHLAKTGPESTTTAALALALLMLGAIVTSKRKHAMR